MKIVIGGSPDGASPFARGDATEPEIEIYPVGDRIVLSTELPGISPEQIQVLFKEDRVYIWAKDPDRQYRASRKVPPATKESVEISFRHGVLEVSYLPTPAGAEIA
jgi:HSP20 family molecular chaperone IbpA